MYREYRAMTVSEAVTSCCKFYDKFCSLFQIEQNDSLYELETYQILGMLEIRVRRGGYFW